MDDSGREVAVSIDELKTLPRHELEADFHCVATWTTRDLLWSGIALGDFLRLAIQKLGSTETPAWVGLRGLDGYRASLPWEFANRKDVLLAHHLAGTPLDRIHGAPVRVVAPAHYGYKSVKHLSEVRLLQSRPRGSPGWKEHPVGLVAEEQRVQHIPGWLFRWMTRPVARPLMWYYRLTANTKIGTGS